MEKKEKGKVIEFKAPEEPTIVLSSRVVQALLESIDAGNWSAAQSVCHEIRQIGEDQGQFPMPPHRQK